MVRRNGQLAARIEGHPGSDRPRNCDAEPSHEHRSGSRGSGMSDPVLLIAKLGQLNDQDRSMLREAGIVVLEVQRPEEVRLVRPQPELDSGEILRAAMRVVKKSGWSVQS